MKRWLTALWTKLQQPDPDGVYHPLYLYHRMWAFLKPYWWRAAISAVITIPIGMLDGAVAYSLKPYMDGIPKGGNFQHTELVPFIIVGLTAVQGILQYFSIYLTGWLSFHITSDMRRTLYLKLLSREPKYFDNNSSGNIIQRYFKDPEVLQQNLLENSKTILTRFFSSVSLIGVLVLTSWKLSIIAVAILLLILFPSTRIRSIMKNLARDLTLQGGMLLGMYTESVGGIKVIYSYTMQKDRMKRFNALQRMMFDRTMKKVKAHGWMTPSMHMIAAIGIASIIWQGSRMIGAGDMTTGGMVSFIAALIMLYNPIKNLGASLMNTQMSFLAASRVFNLLDEKPAIEDKPDAKTLKAIKQSIRFEDVLFTYNYLRNAVLKDFNLEIPVGQTLALVGHSGSGKTTIANLIPRFYDVYKGQITIDGVDIRDYTQHSLRSQIAIVMQDNFLFDGTIRDNLMIGRPDATEAQVHDALDKAYLTDFLLSLKPTIEEALDEPIGERGVMLSGGQRQRIAIARALLKDAPIVILDEATSALDNQSEAIVQQAIESLMKNRTVIVIAHRLSTIRNADRIVVMDKGQIVEEGRHDVLLEQNGLYRQLYETQFAEQDSKEAVIEATEQPV